MIDLAEQAPLPVLRAQRSTMQDHVYRQLCDLILNGEIAPGQLITIQTLADAFGVSAMPVREALQRLTAARVLTVVSGRTIGVPPLTNSRLKDLRRVRLEVEAIAGQWATSNIEEAHLKRLDNLIADMNKAARAGDRKQYVRLNRNFHFTIYAAAGSEALLAIIENLWLQISPYFHLLHASGNYLKANEQHGLIRDALRRRDTKGVRNGLRTDINAAYDVLVGLLDDR
jgi:DNA-binding GntR family transcriptional regulator